MCLSKASCCSLWLSVNTATSPNLLWFIFTGFRRQRTPQKSSRSSFPKAQPGSRSSALRAHYRPGQAAWPRPQGPLTGQALNPGCFFRGSFQSPHDPQFLSVLHCQWLISAFVSFATPGTELVPVAIIGPLRASPRLGTEQVPQVPHRDHTTTSGSPAIYLVGKTSFLLALGRCHNLPLNFHISTSARLHLVAAPRSSLDETGHWSFADATPRRPAKHHSRLQTRPAGHTGPSLSQQSGVPTQACRPVVKLKSRPQASVVQSVYFYFWSYRPNTYYW